LGESQSDLVEALVDSVNGFFGEGDILPTSQGIANEVGVKGVLDAGSGTSTVEGVPFVLIDGTGTLGDSYLVQFGGSYDYGSGPITPQVGQFLIYNASNIWEKSLTPALSGYIPVPFFQFDGSVVRFFEAEYTVIRQFLDGTNILFETGKIFGENDPNDTWSIQQQRYGSNKADVYFDINSNGRIIYSSSKMYTSGKSYDSSASKITFKVKSIIK